MFVLVFKIFLAHLHSRFRLKIIIKSVSPKVQVGSYKIVNGDIKYSIGDTVNNIVIAVCGARWVLEISGGTICKVYDWLTTMLHT